MKRLLLVTIVVLLVGAGIGAYFFNRYWIHRLDKMIVRQAEIYRLDPDLVWSVIYEETYFRPWKLGKDGEIGLMQVTPAVAREWAAETGIKDFERQMAQDPESALKDPERNIQVGCWYLEKLFELYRDTRAVEARMIAGYNAGPSRVAQWGSGPGGNALTTEQFLARIDIPSTQAYVASILERYQRLKDEKGSGLERAAGSPPLMLIPNGFRANRR
jgi:soluble lytic murein transglycosylase